MTPICAMTRTFTVFPSLSTRLVASQQSFTCPTEPVHSPGLGPDQAAENQPGGAEGVGGSGAARAEQGGAVRGNPRVLTSEETQQAFLSRLLLLLASFVVLCLILF